MARPPSPICKAFLQGNREHLHLRAELHAARLAIAGGRVLRRRRHSCETVAGVANRFPRRIYEWLE